MTRQQVTQELKALLEQHFQTDRGLRRDRFRVSEAPKSLTLAFSEGDQRFELVLSNSFVQQFPSGLALDVRHALRYLGEYLRCTDGGKLLLTARHAYQSWSYTTLGDEPLLESPSYGSVAERLSA